MNLDQQSTPETSSDIRLRVEKAQQPQFARYQEQMYNAKVPFEILTATSPLTENQRKMITQVSAKKQWSNRVQIKIIRLARIISDLVGEQQVTDESIWKAITLRRVSHHKVQIIARNGR